LYRNRLPASSLAQILAAAALLLPVAPAWAAAGEVTHLSGTVLARKPDGQSRILSVKSEVAEGDILATADNSYARVKFSDGTEAVLRPATQVKIDTFKYDEQRPQQDNVAISLLKGGMRAVTGLLARRNPASFRIATPSATIGIRGTHFGVQYCNKDCAGQVSPKGGSLPDGLYVDVADGVITVTSKVGSVVVTLGEFAYVLNANSVPVLVPGNEGVKTILPPQATNPAPQGGTVGTGGGLACSI
jgi:hypothetical protein